MAPRNSFTLDGVPLTDATGRWFVERSTGLRSVPGKRDSNLQYPGWDGTAFTPGSPLTPGTISIKMYVEGTDHENFLENMEFIIGLFMQRHKLLDLVHHYNVAGTENRVAKVKFSTSTVPKMLTTTQGTIEFLGEIPDGIWRGDSLITQMVGTMTAVNTYYNLTSFAGANAPMGDSIIRFKGAFNTAFLEDSATGMRISVQAALTSTEYLLIDTKTWECDKMVANTWNFGGTDWSANVKSWRGFGPMHIFEPMMNSGILTYRANIWCTSPSSSPTVEVRAYKEFL